MTPIELLTLEEQTYITTLLQESSFQDSVYYIIGGVRFGDGWIWSNSLRKVDYDIEWASDQPDNYNSEENCLSVHKSEHGIVSFNDLMCNGVDNYANVQVLCQNKICYPKTCSNDEMSSCSDSTCKKQSN